MRFSKFLYFKNRIFWSRNEENKNGKNCRDFKQTSSALNVSRSSVGDYCQKFKYLNLDVDDFLKLSVEKKEELLFPKTPIISQLDNKKILPDCNYYIWELKIQKRNGLNLFITGA